MNQSIDINKAFVTLAESIIKLQGEVLQLKARIDQLESSTFTQEDVDRLIKSE